MAIQMTRAEYEAKYGTQPVAPTTTPSTTAPIKMTRAEYNAKYGTPKTGVVQSLAQGIAKPFLSMASQVKDVERTLQGEKLQGPQEYDYGYFGKNKSFGQATPDIEGLKTAQKAAGAGLEIGSYAAPANVALKGATTLAKAKELAKIGGVTGLGQGVGQAFQEEKGLGGSALQGLGFGTGGAVIAGSIPYIGKGINAITNRLTTPTEQRLENLLLEKFSKGVKPNLGAKKTLDQVEKYDKNVLNAVKTIRENEPNLSFVSDEGEAIVGQTPKTLKQFTDATEQTKKQIFTQYDDLARTAGGNGLSVEFTPIAKELDSVINNKALQLSNPKAIEYAIQTKNRFTNAGKVDAITAQEIVQNYNKALEAFYRNPSYDNASQVAIDAMVANNIRKSLDEGIEGLTGKAYQELKNKYASLKTIERDVIKAFLRDERKNTKGLIDFTDVFSGGQVVNGIMSLNPASVAQGVAAKAIASFYKTLNDPNKAIEKIFDIAKKLPPRETKKVAPRLALPPASSLFRSQVSNQSVIPLGTKTQTKADEEMISKFSNQSLNQRNQISQTKNPTANIIPKTGESANKIKNNNKGIIDGTLPSKDNLASGKVLKAFENSKPIKQIGEFELGTFGNNSFDRKTALKDRLLPKDLEETFKNIKTAYRSSSDPNSYRFDNVAWISEMPNGEKRVIYTRLNSRGKEEIINAHKISDNKYIEDLAKNGVPERTRTSNLLVRTEEPYPFGYGNNSTLPPNEKGASGQLPGFISPRTLGSISAATGFPLVIEGINDSVTNDQAYIRNDESTPQINTQEVKQRIANNESRGVKNPYLIKKFSGSPRMGFDLGKYQITSARLKEKSKDFLGRVVSDDEFVNSPELQEQFMDSQIKWLKSFGLSDDEILATHRGGWGDLSKEHLARVMKERANYVNNK